MERLNLISQHALADSNVARARDAAIAAADRDASCRTLWLITQLPIAVVSPEELLGWMDGGGEGGRARRVFFILRGSMGVGKRGESELFWGKMMMKTTRRRG